ncbi:MAG TPA: hypothetical protein DCZ61_08300 [Lachnospiraceae bacterium]|nr:hypothetical protein [Lachnospiraceae bacterium]
MTILGQLESYRDTAREDYYTVMPESTALIILQSVVQNPYTKASGISMTQYSVIYNNQKKTVEVWPFQNYSKSFVFDVSGNRISDSRQSLRNPPPVEFSSDWDPDYRRYRNAGCSHG